MVRRFTGEPPCCHRGDDDHLEKHRWNPHRHLEKHLENLLGKDLDNLEKHPHCQLGRSRWDSRGGSPAQETKSTLDEG